MKKKQKKQNEGFINQIQQLAQLERRVLITIS